MTRVAFYAPMKPVDHPTPSGDRRMARLFRDALNHAGYDVEIASAFRVRDGVGDAAAQNNLIAAASDEIQRLIRRWQAAPPDIWFTYHCYYKSPDLLGPALSHHFSIPYMIAEATRASKRLDGAWDRFARCAEAAIDSADLLLAMTAHDRFALDRDTTPNQMVVDFLPFLDVRPAPVVKASSETLRLLTVAMMRDGDKLASYRHLASAMPFLDGDWSLTIVGDGPARDEVTRLFKPFSAKVEFLGEIDEAALRVQYEAADIFAWPGVNEAYGMVYLEAQASGTPVVALDFPGPRAVIGPGSILVQRDDPMTYASAIAETANDDRAGRLARDYILANHTLDAAASRLSALIGGLA